MIVLLMKMESWMRHLTHVESGASKRGNTYFISQIKNFIGPEVDQCSSWV